MTMDNKLNRVCAQRGSRLIGFHGFKTSGKDTAAALWGELVNSLYGQTWCKRGFADEVKLSIARMFDPHVTMAEAIMWCDKLKFDGRVTAMNPPGWKSYNISGRDFIVNFAQMVRRYDDSFWIDLLLPGTYRTDQFADADFALISDVRFPPEIRRIHELGGYVFYVDRPGLGPDGAPGEISHRDLCDGVLDNSKDIDHLRKQIHAILSPSHP